MNGQGGNIFPVQDNGALRRPDKADHGVKGRGFTGAVGAQQTDDRGGGNLEIDLVDHPPVSVLLDQVSGLKQRAVRRHFFVSDSG